MSTRIRFRGNYEPYLIGQGRPFDDSPFRSSRGPRALGVRPMEKDGMTCSSCSLPIQLKQPSYRTRRGTWRHERCAM